LTRDLDLADVRRYPPSLYPGIIVLRLSDGVIAEEIMGVTERFLRDATFVACTSGLHWPQSHRRIWRKRAAETHTQQGYQSEKI
jgi:hypothetical protein